MPQDKLPFDSNMLWSIAKVYQMHFAINILFRKKVFVYLRDARDLGLDFQYPLSTKN